MRGPIFNQDDSEFCATRRPDQVSGEAVDAWVDGLAEAGVGTLITCVGAMTTNYASRVWEPRWARYDPAGPDDQPVLRHLPPGRIAGTRRWLESERRLAELGINFHARAAARARQRGVSPWVSVRMNDLHDCDLEDSPLLSTFYKSQRGQLRVPYRTASWPDRALDWTRADVRDHYLALIRELLHDLALDLDGLELDWMRFGYHFPIGREAEGGRLLTTWLADVRAECARAASRLGHPVRLGVRVPSTPETARQLGLDGAGWARAGLIDLLVVTPFWATCEFAMPVRTWQMLLAGTGVPLAGGLEIRYQPHPGAKAPMMTPELAAGAATAVLSEGADFVYLFNYFLQGHLHDQWSPELFRSTLAAMRDLATLDALPRRHAVTFRDVRAPGEPADHPLPARGRVAQFRLPTGPRPTGRAVAVEVGLATGLPAPRVRVNSALCGDPTALDDGWRYPVPPTALADGQTVIDLEAASAQPLDVQRVEIVIAAR